MTRMTQMNRLNKLERSEFLLELGRVVRRNQRRGRSMCVLAQDMDVAADLLSLAHAFDRAPDVLKLRAIVEDWSLDQIKDALRTAAPAVAQA